ncbi:ATP-dependent Clp protease, proteolytic subunit [Cyanidiococcus yangmingshanensis]|uniref:ATP-dependent Clp protease proteolytic subunit n=1 Tax=Cyanidiococcus yangmingshanensis TaxID=2690220 RepID=A0A7J7IJV0_9RHOD|nr:ATP-dependent Clp protease, proteolytic subunit [Cyanidiococcus yangmingshanensis]
MTAFVPVSVGLLKTKPVLGSSGTVALSASFSVFSSSSVRRCVARGSFCGEGVCAASCGNVYSKCRSSSRARDKDMDKGAWSLRCSSANAPMTIEGARIGPPPDLPSLLLHNRIVYIGMPLTAPVCELIIAELLYLNYNDPDKPVYVYINSTGTMGLDGSTAGFETDAFAIIDTMNYIKPPVYTICVGSAFGLAAVILACGDKGNRAALPNASIMLHQPRGTARGQAADIAIKAREIMYNRKVAMEILAEHTGRPVEECLTASERTKYMTPQEAKEFGIIDKILRSEKDMPKEMPAFLKQL